jgi:Terpene synthase family 2, C-terminal metal binding
VPVDLSPRSARPALVPPFASRINPGADALQEHCDAWAERSGMLEIVGPGKWRAARYGRLVARMYPQARAAELELIGEAVLWLFLYDDYLPPGEPAVEQRRTRRLADLTAAALSGGLAERPESPVGPLWDLRERMLAAGDLEWWQRCAADVRDFAEAIHRESFSRAEPVPPPLDVYVPLRRATSGWALLTDLVELAVGTALPKAMLHLPEYEEMRWTSGDAACAINDLLSLDKELAAGEFHNLVLVIQRSDVCGREEALDLVELRIADHLFWYQDARDRFLHRCDSGPFDEAERAAAHGYARGLEHLVRGSLDWSRESGRYVDAVAGPPQSARPDLPIHEHEGNRSDESS